MKIRNKILLAWLATLLLMGIAITGIWYSTSQKLTNVYLKNVSESTMQDAYHAFEYLLTDTSYMATLAATNEANIIEPVIQLNREEISRNGQWNQTYLNNRRIIMNYIKSLNGYKYYISGIAVAANRQCVFATNYIIQDKETLYEDIVKLDQEQLKHSMVMMEPMHLEGLKSTISSDYVLPAVRGIVNDEEEIVGYVILYFDYGVIDQMFSANLPEGSFFQVVNEKNALIFSNSGKDASYFDSLDDGYAKNIFEARSVGWTFHMAIPSEFYTAGIHRTAMVSAVVTTLLIAISLLATIVIVSKMTTEISVLSGKMKSVSSGDLTVRYEVKGNDEIAQMGKTFNHMIVRIQELMERVAQEEREKRLNEMAFLQAQINPHFVSNVMNNVVWMAKIQHADNIVPLVNSLNALLQNVMHQDREFIPLKNELEYVDNYLVIMEYSGSYDFEIIKEVEEDTLSLLIPRFILQPIVENAIYHGLPEDLAKRGRIIISSKRCDNNLVIIVEDNGEGISEEKAEEVLKKKKGKDRSFNGIGVVNVNERIKIYFGDCYGLHCESKKGKYTKCILTLPIVEEEI
ncbi:MAG: sensor histidine kinase [Lachnospiraceae bacterium]|nr:sensor histidine kinase [Lachnospiraceae bacterium]